MTHREAIEILEDDKTSIDSSISYGITNVMTLQRYIDFSEAIDLAIKALEKQEPMKPIGRSVTQEGSVGNCPNCNRFVAYFNKLNRCDCGQAIDWSE